MSSLEEQSIALKNITKNEYERMDENSKLMPCSNKKRRYGNYQLAKMLQNLFAICIMWNSF